MYEVKLPQTSEEEMESVVVFWHKSEGDWVDKGDVLVEVQTEKAVFEIEAEYSGVLKKILVPRGEVAAVGDVLALIDQTEQQNEQGPAQPDQQPPLENQLTSASEKQKTTRPTEPKGFVSASPRVRRLARQLGVDLATVKGTGPQGRPTEEDVKKAAQNQVAATSRDTSPHQPAAVHIRQTIARRMMESLHQSAQLTETAWADVTDLARKRKQIFPELSWNDWIVYATVQALKDHPYLNASWEYDKVTIHSHIHLGIAVDTEQGLLVPVVKHAEQKDILQLHQESNRIIQKAKEGRLERDEATESTFTVSNLGGYGIQFFTPIINPPEAAILGIGQIETYLVLQNGQVEERLRLPLSLTFDHRITDGGPAARFLQTLSRLLSDPDSLL